MDIFKLAYFDLLNYYIEFPNPVAGVKTAIMEIVEPMFPGEEPEWWFAMLIACVHASTTPPMTTTPPEVCADDQYTCQEDHQCIDGTRVCDGEYDCRDQTDEIDCTTPPPPTTTPTPIPGMMHFQRQCVACQTNLITVCL